MQKPGSRVTAGVQDDLKIILAQRSSRCRVLCSPRLRPIWCHHGQMYAIRERFKRILYRQQHSRSFDQNICVFDRPALTSIKSLCIVLYKYFDISYANFVIRNIKIL